MREIVIIAVGSVKEDYYREAIAEYIKRSSPWARITVREIKEERLSDNPGEAEIRKALEKEGEAIASAIASVGKSATVIPLCIEGKGMSTSEFASHIENACSRGAAVFVIGSSFGLCDAVKSLGRGVSFSAMTFPHRLMRVILCEQIYRSMSILNGGKYHK